MAQQIATSEPNSCFTVPAKHVLPNLSEWTIPTTACAVLNVAISQWASQGLSRALNTNSDNNTIVPPLFLVTSGSTVHYLNPPSGSNLVGAAMPINVHSTAPVGIGVPKVVRVMSIATPQTEPNAFTVQNLAKLLASSRKKHLPEWKLAQYNGDLSLWHEWFGQFKSAIDSAPLTDYVKLTYLKTLVTGKPKAAIAEFAYCGTMYKDALKTLEWNFGQRQAVVSAFLDKLSNLPPLKMHNSEGVISYSARSSALVGFFRSLH